MLSDDSPHLTVNHPRLLTGNPAQSHYWILRVRLQYTSGIILQTAGCLTKMGVTMATSLILSLGSEVVNIRHFSFTSNITEHKATKHWYIQFRSLDRKYSERLQHTIIQSILRKIKMLTSEIWYKYNKILLFLTGKHTIFLLKNKVIKINSYLTCILSTTSMFANSLFPLFTKLTK